MERLVMYILLWEGGIVLLFDFEKNWVLINKGTHPVSWLMGNPMMSRISGVHTIQYGSLTS
jgi:hypothetical protein